VTTKEDRGNTALFRAAKELLLSYTVEFVVNIYIYTVIVVVSSSIDIPQSKVTIMSCISDGYILYEINKYSGLGTCLHDHV
jgi:hypothetical protein